VCTRSVASLDEHPLPILVAAGVPITINSDDPPMFSTTLDHEYLVAARLLDLDKDGVADLAREAVMASFMPEPDRQELLARIAKHEMAWATRIPDQDSATPGPRMAAADGHG
jgi:aminodeoxyfutalosine deaminase